MNFFSFELLSVLFTIMIIVKFRLNQKFIIWLLRGVKIFLPPTDSDNQTIKLLKKGKIQNQRADALVRTCEVHEYINGIKDDNYTEADVIVFFYLTTLINLIIIELERLSDYFFKITSNDDNKNSDKDTDYSNTINIAASFALITVGYLLYSMFKSNFKMGYKSYDAKIFYAFNFLFFIFSIFVLSYFENLIPIDYDNVCLIINDRIQRISLKTNDGDSDNRLRYSSNGISGLCNKFLLKIFYSLVFSFILSLVYRSSTNLAEFDNIIFNITDKQVKKQNNIKRNFDMIRAAKLIKIKQVLSVFILFLMIDPLMKSFLIENKYLSDISYHFIILFPVIFIEMLISSYSIKYYAELFLESNYYDMLNYCENPSDEGLIIIRKKIPTVNTIFWEIFMRIIYMTFMALILFILYINRANAISNLDNISFKFRSGFVDSVVYLWILGIFFSKAIFYNAYTYYLRYYNKNKTIFTV
jgi:hypothetical protein